MATTYSTFKLASIRSAGPVAHMLSQSSVQPCNTVRKQLAYNEIYKKVKTVVENCYDDWERMISEDVVMNSMSTSLKHSLFGAALAPVFKKLNMSPKAAVIGFRKEYANCFTPREHAFAHEALVAALRVNKLRRLYDTQRLSLTRRQRHAYDQKLGYRFVLQILEHSYATSLLGNEVSFDSYPLEGNSFGLLEEQGGFSAVRNVYLAASDPDTLIRERMDNIPALRLVNSIASAMEKAGEYATRVYLWFKENVSLWFGAFLSAFTRFIRYFSPMVHSMLRSLIKFISNTMFTGAFVTIRIEEWLDEFFDANPPEKVPGAFPEEQNAAFTGLKLLTSYYTANGWSFKPTPKAISMYSSVSKGYDSMISDVLKFIVEVLGSLTPSWMCEAFSGPSSKDVKEWLDECQDLFIRNSRSQLLLSENTLRDIRDKIHQGTSFMENAKKHGYEALSPHIRDIVLKLEAMEKEIAPRFDARQLTRPRPVVCMFYGPSGKGKSNLMFFLAKLFAAHFCEEDEKRKEAFLENPRDQIFLMGNDKYYDGANQYQSVFLADDYNQRVAKAGDETSLGGELIHINNDASYPLRQAALQMKNNVFAHFKVSLYSTNSERYDDPTVLHPWAVANRVNFLIEVDRKTDNVQPVAGQTFDYKSWQLRVSQPSGRLSDPPTNSLDFQNTGELITVNELFHRVIKQYEINTQYFESSQVDAFETLKSMKDEFAQEAANRAFKQKMSAKYNHLQQRISEGFPEKLARALWSSYRDGDDPYPLWENVPLIINQAGEFHNTLSEANWEYDEKKFTDCAAKAANFPKVNFPCYVTPETAYLRTPFGHTFTFNTFKSFYPTINFDEFSGQDMYDFCREVEVHTLSCPVIAPSVFSETVGKVRETVSAWVDVIKIAYNEAYEKACRVFDVVLTWLCDNYWFSIFCLILGACIASYFGKPLLDSWFTSSIPDTCNECGLHYCHCQSGNYPGNNIYMREKHKKSTKHRDLMRDLKMAKHAAETQGYYFTSYFRQQMYRPRDVNTYPSFQGAVEDIVPKIQKNLFSVNIDVCGRQANMGYALGISGRRCVMPLHFVTGAIAEAKDKGVGLTDTICITLQNDSQEIAFFLNDIIHCAYEETCETDAFFFVVPNKAFQEVPSIEKHFLTQAEASTVLFTVNRATSAQLVKPEVATLVTNLHGQISMPIMSDGEFIEKKNLVSYFCDNYSGLCGAVLVSTGSRFAGKLFGIHVAGQQSSRASFAAILTKEMIKDFTTDPVEEQRKDFHGDLNLDYITKDLEPLVDVHIKNNLVPWNPMDKPIIPYKTKATVPSPKLFKQNRAAFGKVVTGPIKYDTSLIDFMSHHYLNHSGFYPGSDRVYSVNEAIMGIPGTHFGGIDSSSSVGYPDTAFGIKGKDYWSVSETGEFVPGPLWNQFSEELEALRTMLSYGATPAMIYKDCMKGERIKSAKVEAGKIRFINVMPKSFVVLFKQYFGFAIHALAEGAPMNTILKGYDEKNTEYWTTIGRYLDCFGDNVGAGDYSGFDHHQSRLSVAWAFDLFEAFYPNADAVDQIIRLGLKQLVIEQFHAYGSVVERYSDGMPSGLPLTSEINCVTNLRLFITAYLDGFEGDLAELPKFFDRVHAFFLGDDNIFAVHPEIASWYTPRLIAATVAKEGHVYTDVNKGPAPEKLGPLSEATILKRSFRKKADGFYDGPLDLDTILEIPMWTRDNSDREIIAAQNMDTAIRELSLHGREVFEKWIPKFREFSGPYFHPFSTDYDTVHKIVSGSKW